MAFKLPQIPSVPAGIDPSVNRVLTSLRTFAQALPKYIAQQAKATATSEVKKSSISSGGGSGGGGGGVPDPGLPGTPGGHPVGLPTVPTNLTVTSTSFVILLQWDGAVYQGSDHADISRNTVNDFLTAGSVGTTQNNVFADHPPVEAVDPNTGVPQVWWYFVVFVNKNGVRSAPASISASLVPDPSYVLSVMKTGIIDSTPLYNLLKGSDPNSLAGIHSNITSSGTQYHFVKTDVNGHISGYGLYNTGTTSSFIVVADKFGIAAPGSPDKIPFTVDAQTGLVGIDGNLVVTGSIHGDSAILDGTITANKLSVVDLSSITATLGTITAGTMLSSNWAATQGTFFDLVSSQFHINGWDRTYTGLSFDGVNLTLNGKFAANVINAVNTLQINGNAISFAHEFWYAGSAPITYAFQTHGTATAHSISLITLRFTWSTATNTAFNLFVDGGPSRDTVSIGGGSSGTAFSVTLQTHFDSGDSANHTISFTAVGGNNGNNNYKFGVLEVLR